MSKKKPKMASNGNKKSRQQKKSEPKSATANPETWHDPAADKFQTAAEAVKALYPELEAQYHLGIDLA